MPRAGPSSRGMAWHKWFVRGFVFSILGSACLGVLAYQHWTNPAAVGTLVRAKTSAMFPGGVVTLDSASLRLFGGIQVHEFHLVRRDDPGDDIAHIPSAILYHNKEKMLDGELSFRKIELHRPRLRVVRARDGKWNVQGLSGADKAGQPVPTIVVHEATIQLEDHSREGVAPFKLELTGANLTLINDPPDVVTIDGAAQADLLGKVVVHGAWRRQENEIALSIKTLGTCLNNALLERVACFCPAGKLSGLQLDGQAQVQVEVAFRPGADAAFSLKAQCQVSKTTVQHPELPFPLNQVEASLRFDGSDLHVESLRAEAGATVLTAQGVGRLPCPDQDFEGSLRVEHLEMDENLGAHLPDKLKPLMRIYQPRGRITVQVDVARRGGQWTAPATPSTPPSQGGGVGGSRITVQPEGISACFERFPYPLHKVSGTIHYLLPQQRFHVDLTGYAHDQPVFIRGHWQGEGQNIDTHYEITTDGLPIDPVMIAAIPEPMRTTVKSFHVQGKVGLKAEIRRRPADDKFHAAYHIRLQDGTIVWDEFPFPLTQVSGFIDVFPTSGSWQFRDLQGTHGDGQVSIFARSADPDGRHDKPGVYVELIGKNLPLDADLHTALRTMPPLAKAWETFQPSGRLNFTATIDRRGKQPEDLEVRVDVKGPSVRPEFFPYPLHDFAGHFHLHDERLDLRRLSANHASSRWYIDKGSVELHATGAYYANLPELQMEHLVLDHELIAALPPRLRAAVSSMRCQDALRLKTQLIVSHSGAVDALPDVYWDGQAWLDNAALTVGLDFKRVTGTVACIGRHNGRHLTGLTGNFVMERAAVFNQPIRKLQGRFHVKEAEPELLLLDLKAPIFGGDIAGQVSLDFHDLPRYELNLTASQIDLLEFGRHNLGLDSKLSGVIVARLHLTGVGDDPTTLDGNGTLDVPNGKLLNLPFLLDLIKFLGLRWPDRTLFEEMHARYAIRGRRATIQHLELFGNAVSFTGKGAINLDGTDVQLELYPSWARIEQLLPPALRSMPPALSKNILTVEARGKITGNRDDIRFTKKPVPIIVDPLLNLRDRLVGPSVETRRPAESNQSIQTLYRKEP